MALSDNSGFYLTGVRQEEVGAVDHAEPSTGRSISTHFHYFHSDILCTSVYMLLSLDVICVNNVILVI